MTIIGVNDLNVYKRSVKVLDLVYQLIKQIPNIQIKLKKQVSSSAEPIPVLIAEGWGKR